MAKKNDDDLFEDVPYMEESDDLFEDVPYSENSMDMSAFEEEQKPDVNMLESSGRGAVQGASLGFADEIGAFIKAIPEKMSQDISEKDSKNELDNLVRRIEKLRGYKSNKPVVAEDFSKEFEADKFSDIYKEYRDVTREANKDAKEANPWTYGVSEVVGGIAPALATGGGSAAVGAAGLTKEGLIQAGKLGGKYGLASGAGYSEADLTEGEVGEFAADTALGGVIGAGAGAALPVLGKGIKTVADKSGVGDFVETQAKKLPILDEFIESYKLSKAGKGVVGKENYEEIIGGSKEAAKELQKFLNTENSKYSNAIGKIYKRITKLGESKDVSKELASIEKQANNLLKSGKSATEDGKKALNTLLDSIEQFKTTSVKPYPTKNVKTSVESAIDNINKTKAKMQAQADEVGEKVNFTEPKIDTQNGTVTVFETVSGKPITVPLKSGEFTPIKYKTGSDYKDLDIDQLKGLKDVLGQLSDDAGKLRVEKKPIARAGKEISSAINEAAEDAGLGNALSTGNKGFSQIKNIEKSLPADLIKNSDPQNINKVAQFLRKAEMEGLGGDDLRDRLVVFGEQLKIASPEFYEKFMPKVNEIAKRYDLARVARQSFGLNLFGTGKATGVLTGAAAGATRRAVGKAASKVVSPVISAKKAVTDLTDDQLASYGSKLATSENKGLQDIGQKLIDASTMEGAGKQQLLWSLSQSPAMRELIKQQAGSVEQDEQEILNYSDTIEVPEQGETQEVSSVDMPKFQKTSEGREPAGEVDNSIEDFIDNTVIAKHERGYQANPKDTGNYVDGELVGTNFGIAAPTLKAYLGKDITAEDMKNLTKETARKIYMDEYYTNSGVSKLPSDKQEAVLDFVINSGQGNAIKAIQRKAGIKADGLIGPQTIKAVESMTVGDLVDVRKSFIENAGGIDDSFKEGLLKRAESFRPNPMDEILAPYAEQEIEPSKDMMDILSPYAEQELPSEVEIDDISRSIDMTNQMQSSGDNTPVDQLDALLAKINMLNLPEEQIDDLEEDAVNMTGYRDGLALKEKIMRLIGA